MSRSIQHTSIGLASLAAAIVVSPALGLPATSSAPDAFERAVARHVVQNVRPDDRGGVLGIGAASRATDVFERAVARSVRPDNRAGSFGIGELDSQPTGAAPAATQSSNGFHWNLVAIGAAGLAGLCMVILAAVARQREHRRRLAMS
jgi:hypothetical protein